ncbi:HPP family protein [Fimbriiglobus ruber]|uniref:CBS domain protein n=1 Tax=Fimbriiglobus ruber TaxID=1908690 RepID=A0A225DBK9_9BACT|nr:CBS domain-containing protein [Fimbriiglobus ruber]OWK35908.1 CBS domain protein [Fimbriiglobus ruber]
MRLTAEIARDLMTPGPYSIADVATVEQATAFLTDRGFGAAVAIDLAGHPVGVVTKTDLLVHARERDAKITTEPGTVRDVMTPAVFSVREETTARSVVEQLITLNVHHLFVVDRTGVVVGVISPMDVVRRLV